jgi:hypothetical protein
MSQGALGLARLLLLLLLRPKHGGIQLPNPYHTQVTPITLPLP